VVDDDPLVRESVADLLSSSGFAVRTFGSATELVRSERPDVSAWLILDVELPGLSGLDLQVELAKSGIEMPIVFLTGHGDIPMSVRAMKAGAVECKQRSQSLELRKRLATLTPREPQLV
jgi:FixJ family two-component response regulator